MGWLSTLLFDSRSDGSSLNNPSVPLSAATLRELGDGAYYGESAGQTVTTYRALGYAPLYQAVGMISGDCAKMPMNVYKRVNGGRQLQAKHPVQSRVHITKAANPEVNAFKFWRRWFVSACLHSNAYAYIDRAGNGQVLGLYNLLPDRTKPVRVKGKLYYVTEVGGTLEAINPENILHTEGVTLDNACGADVIKMFREDFAIALARRNFTAKFFKNNLTAGGILQVPPTAKPEAVRKVVSKMNEKFTASGESSFKTLVLRDGFKWFSTQVNPENAQLSEMDADQARNIARIYNLHPSKLGVPGANSYNTLEQAESDYYNGALSHHLIATKSEANIKLLSESEREEQDLYLEYNINALLWADAKTRSEIANTGIQSGRFSPNETRAWENLDAYDGGDALYRPANLVPVAQDLAATADTPAVRRLLTDSFGRACNRIGIKAERSKAYAAEALGSDRQTLIEIVEPAVAVALERSGEIAYTAEQLSEEWIDSWTAAAGKAGDATALRNAAEAAAAVVIAKALGKT